MRYRFPWRIWMLFLAAALAPLSAVAQVTSAGLPEYQVKAAFILNFARFVDWPVRSFRNRSDPIQICISGEDPFGSSMEEVTRGQRVSGRAVQVRRLCRNEHPAGCHILYLGAEEPLSRLLPQIPKSAILTVGETPEFLDSGGILQFAMKERKVQFRVNLTSAKEAGLHLSSKLLSVAREVK